MAVDEAVVDLVVRSSILGRPESTDASCSHEAPFVVVRSYYNGVANQEDHLVPKVVDHQERRREIADAVARIARDRGLAGVSFREVASEAGVSVSLIQHYFGSKERLLVATLEIQSSRFADLIATRLANVDASEDPMMHLRTISASFIPTDDDSRAAMLLYHAFAGAALTDPELRSADAFRNAELLRAAIAGDLEFARDSGAVRSAIVPTTEATVILSLVLGLSLATLLEQTTPEQALAVMDAHLAGLTGSAGLGPT